MYKKGLVFMLLAISSSTVLLTGCGCVKTVVKTPTDLEIMTSEAERTNAAGTSVTTSKSTLLTTSATTTSKTTKDKTDETKEETNKTTAEKND